MKELFAHKTELTLPDIAYILAPGILGKPHHSEIPEDAFVIAVNKGILSDREADVWMVWAKWYCRAPWFEESYRRTDAITIFGRQAAKNLLTVKMKADYCFDYEPHFSLEPKFVFMNGLLRTGATISGAALQLCYFWGVKEVYLIGVDMFGRLYFDGTKNLSLKKEEKTWDDCDNMNRMIRLCEGGGMTVKSLSETKLEVERV